MKNAVRMDTTVVFSDSGTWRSPLSLDGGGEPWSLLAAGDCCPNGQFEDAFRSGHPERALDTRIIDRFARAAITIVNLETPLCGPHRPIEKTGPCIRVDPAVASGLRAASIRCVALANNHIFDYGLDGLEETIRALDAHGIAHHGAGRTHEEAIRPISQAIRGHRVALVSLAEGEFARCEGDGPGAARLDSTECLDAIRRAAAAHDIVIVSVHGGSEYQSFPSPAVQRRYRRLVDAGARLVLGHHPHILQGIEWYRDAVIAYSLGNFLFDHHALLRWPFLPRRWWNRAIDDARRASDTGALLEVVFSVGQIAALVLHPLRQVRQAQVSLVTGDAHTRVVAYVNAVSEPLVAVEALQALWEQEVREVFAVQGPLIRRWADDAVLHGSPRRRRAALGLMNMVRCDAHRDTLGAALRLIAEGRLTSDRAAQQRLQSLRGLLSAPPSGQQFVTQSDRAYAGEGHSG